MILKPSPNKSTRGLHRPSLVIIHGDAGSTDKGTVEWVCNPLSKVSYHWFVGRDGTLYQFVQETDKAWHAGVSQFHGEEILGSVNPISIGVCFANNGKGDEFYTAKQYEAGGKLVAQICRDHAIPLHRVRGHFEVSPGRKTDPWPWFNWKRFYSSFAYYSADRNDPTDWDRWSDLG
jgi:N-acetylmuramoyl-L-alanine amidase